MSLPDYGNAQNVNGDKQSFKELFDACYLPLRSFAHCLVDDQAATEDFVQDAFVKVWEKWDDFPQPAAARSFLYTITKNACLDYLKHKTVMNRNEHRILDFLTASQHEAMILEEEVHAQIYKAIGGLSIQARHMVLYTMDGLSNAQIAARMDLSVNTVKTVKLRAYRVLREKLSGISWLLIAAIAQNYR